MNAPLQRAVLCFACLVLAACVPKSKHPLSDPALAKPDLGLVGTWHEKDADDEVMVISVKDSHWMHVEDRKKGHTADSYDFFVTEIDGCHFLNAIHFDTDSQGNASREGYYIVRYKLSGHLLSTWHLSEDKLTNAIETGKIRGKIEQDKNPPHVDTEITLQESTANLAKYFHERGPKSLFSNEHSDLYRIDGK
jgi:hypothetical protein